MSESMLEQVKRMAQGLSLGQESADDQRRKPHSLRGSWCGKFPEDFDIDSALHEIRHEWEEERVIAHRKT